MDWATTFDQELEERFGHLFNKKVQYLSPGTPNFRLQRPLGDNKNNGETFLSIIWLLGHCCSCLNTADPVWQIH